MRKHKKDVIEDDQSLKNESKNDSEEMDNYNFYISDEKFSVIWNQETNWCNRTTLNQSLEIKTESCDKDEYFVLQTEKWNFKNIDELIFVLNEFKKKYDIMKNS